MTTAVHLPVYPDATMSSADLLSWCQAWALGAAPVEDEPPGRPARFGNGIHRLLEWAITGAELDVDAALKSEGVHASDAPRFRRVWRNLSRWLQGQDTRGWMAEVAYAYDPLAGTARELGRGINRKYDEQGRLPHEFPGTADIVIVKDDRVVVLDLKTGRSPAERYRMQLLALGLAAARYHGRERATVGVLRADEAMVEVQDRLDAEPEELGWVAEEFKRVWTAPDRTPRGGWHCSGHWCKARKMCAGAAAVRRTG